MNKSDFFCVHDLNLISWMGHHSQMLSDEGDHAFGTIGIRSSDGIFATQSLQSDGCRSTRSTQGSRFQLSGSIPRTGLCSADSSRIAARYRDKFASSAQTFLSYGLALQDGVSQHAGQRKSCQAVGSFCRPGSSFDQNGARTLRRRTDELGTEGVDGRYGVRTRLDDDRFVFEPVQLGSFSNGQSGSQASYVDRFEGLYSEFYSYQRRQNARRQSARPALRARLHRGWRVLCHGQSLRRLRATLQIAYGESLLCDACQRQHADGLDSNVFRWKQHWIGQRSSRSIGRRSVQVALPRATQVCNIHRCRDWKDVRVFDQQLCTARHHDLRSLQATMASGVVF